jgi:hypothetical protein
MPNPRPADDVAIELNELVGTHVLVGLTIEDQATGETRLSQLHGAVTAVDPKKGILLELAGKRSGETYTLPPDTRSFSRAPAGEYRLRETGEVVTNPDFLTTWTVIRLKVGVSDPEES